MNAAQGSVLSLKVVVSVSAPCLIRSLAQRHRHAGPRYVRLICCPYAGAGVSAFTRWADRLPSWIEPLGVQLPGREDRWSEPPLASLEPLLDAFEHEAQAWLSVPVALFGHSLGGLLAFEFARVLERRLGVSPVYLIVSAVDAPSGLRPRRGLLHELPDEEFLREITTLDGLPREVLANPELLSLIVPVLRADVRLYETYRMDPYQLPLASPILAIGGAGDPRVHGANLAAWQLHTRAGCEFALFPGNHFYLHQHRDALLDLIASRLAAAITNSRPPWGRHRWLRQGASPLLAPDGGGR